MLKFDGILRIRTADIFPWTRNAEYDNIIKVHISKFGGGSDKKVHLSGEWGIYKKGQTQLIKKGEFKKSVPWTPSDYAGLVTLMNGLLINFCSEISAGFNR